MKTVYTNKVDEMLSVGKWLGDNGIYNWALTKSQASDVLDKLYNSNIGVLGGDVCKDEEGYIWPNYDSWYSNHIPEESNEDFVTRSIKKSKDYIEQYKPYVTDIIYFTIVPDVSR